MNNHKNSHPATQTGTPAQPEQTVPDKTPALPPLLLREATLKFNPGRIVCTTNCCNQVPGHDLLIGIARHISGDWGEVCPEDWQENELSLKEGFRLLSAYTASNGVKFWIITEWDRSVTTALLPEDY